MHIVCGTLVIICWSNQVPQMFCRLCLTVSDQTIHMWQVSSEKFDPKLVKDTTQRLELVKTQGL